MLRIRTSQSGSVQTVQFFGMTAQYARSVVGVHHINGSWLTRILQQVHLNGSHNMTTEEAVQKVRDVVRLKHLSLATEESYTMWLRRFARFVSEQCDPVVKAEQKMEAVV